MSHDPPFGLLVRRRSVWNPNAENLILMVTAVINLDFVPLFFFFFLYSALEILIARTMEDYRYRLIEIEEEFETESEEFEDDEEFEDEEFEGELEDQDEDDFGDGERERIILPVDLDVLNAGEREEDDYEDDEEDYDEEDYEEEEELMRAERMLHMDPIEDGDYEDEDDDDDYEDEEDYGEEDEDEEDYEEEEVEELIPVEMTSPRVSVSVSSSVFNGRALQGEMLINNGGMENSNGSESCEGKPGSHESSSGEIHGLFCPICFEAWTNGGEHQICCLPCGHIYGLSCIKKWLQQNRISGKCPQCNNLCTFKDVRVLYASRLCVADEELHKRVRSLEAKCAYLERKADRLTPDEMIDKICSNPAALQRLATVIAELYGQPVSP
ncbi:hypothetical protein SSX86_001026 [Deinandra increscens subsp. villosa]|uniref:RING-type domain-containing protein n=1 Tax=Deinandra increscens subsp. villosa TaxID=3103831 RepID=A0AAP0DU19_9ASTR